MMIDLDELSAHLQIQTNLLNEEKAKREIHRSNEITMRTADGNYLTCNAVGCFNKAEYFGTRVHFCQSHMMIAVAS